MGMDRKVFDGTCTRVQHQPCRTPEKLRLELDRSKVHPAVEIVDDVYWPLSKIVETTQTEMPA
jgi:hypothetical protein